jgi:hypothetical protein
VTDAGPTIEDIEQHEIAMEVMYKATANSISETGSLDREKAGAFLRAAAVERHQRGDHRAAELLEEWAEKMGQLLGDRY